MRKLSAIGIWFCLFIFIIVAAFFWMPDSYRIHPRLEMPDIVFLRSQPPQSSGNSILIIGDSFATFAPWPAAKRIAHGGATIDWLIQMTLDNKPDKSITSVLVFAGIYDRDATTENMEQLEDALTLKFSNAAIHTISVPEMLQYAKDYPHKVGGHISEAGYETLRQRHFPHLTF